MSKEVHNVVCYSCDTEYKITFDSDTKGLEPLYCPFCAEVVETDVADGFEYDDEDVSGLLDELNFDED